MSKSNISVLAEAIIAALKPFVETNETKEIIDAVNENLTDESVEETEGLLAGVADEPVGPWALASCMDFYIPWRAKIHTGGKTISKDGTFGRRRNLENDFFIKYEGQVVDTHGCEASRYELDENLVPQLVGETESETSQGEITDVKPTKKLPPKKPAKKLPPKKPAKPVEKVVDESVTLKREIVEACNTLNQVHNVDYDFIISQVLTPVDVESFDDLPEENYAEVRKNIQGWLGWFQLFDNVKTNLQAFDDEHHDDLVAEFEGLVGDMACIEIDKFLPIHREIVELHNNWEAYYNDDEAEA